MDSISANARRNTEHVQSSHRFHASALEIQVWVDESVDLKQCTDKARRHNAAQRLAVPSLGTARDLELLRRPYGGSKYVQAKYLNRHGPWGDPWAMRDEADYSGLSRSSPQMLLLK